MLGIVVGAVLGMIGHALQRGRRDFSSVSSVDVGSYEIQTSRDLVDRARHTLGAAAPQPG